jgi:hypothetical protein
MANDSAGPRDFTDAFNEANKLYDEDDLEACIVKCRELLEDPAMPRYCRMRTLVLLGSCALRSRTGLKRTDVVKRLG